MERRSRVVRRTAAKAAAAFVLPIHRWPRMPGRRLERAIRLALQERGQAYRDALLVTGAMMTATAAAEAAAAARALGRVVLIAGFAPTTGSAPAVILVRGNRLREWFAKLARDDARRLQAAVRLAAIVGEPIDLTKADATSRRELVALVLTAGAAAAAAGHVATFNANPTLLTVHPGSESCGASSMNLPPAHFRCTAHFSAQIGLLPIIGNRRSITMRDGSTIDFVDLARTSDWADLSRTERGRKVDVARMQWIARQTGDNTLSVR